MAKVKMKAPHGASGFTHEGVHYPVEDGIIEVHEHAVAVAESHGFRPDVGPRASPVSNHVPISRIDLIEMLIHLGENVASDMPDLDLIDKLRERAKAFWGRKPEDVKPAEPPADDPNDSAAKTHTERVKARHTRG